MFLNLLTKNNIMKRLLLILFVLTFMSEVYSNPITKEYAVSIATSYLSNKTKTQLNLKSVKTEIYEELNTMYIVNYENGGFVIISADDNVQPILAYSETGSVPESNYRPEFKWWIDNYSVQISYAVKNSIKNENAQEEWDNIAKGQFKEGGKVVTPLLTTTWDQLNGYNTYCPSGTPTGCVATAMAQIMNYYEFPVTGVSWHTYTHDVHGTQSAIFQDGNYQWSSMGNTSGNTAIAWLMYHCGVSVDMDYDASGSGATSVDVPMAMANYFKYDQSIDYVRRADYTDPNWILLLKTELDAARPVYYSGHSASSGGHAFVFDGYDATDKFHVNWGWSGSSNGYYALGDLTPSVYNFNDDNAAVINIQPTTAGNEDFLIVKQYSDFPHVSEYPGYIDGVDGKVAWAIGKDGSGGNANYKDFTRTIDGGATWTSGTVTTPATAFSMISGVNKDTAYIAAYGTGTSNKILRTYDGGTSWTAVLSGAGSSSFFNIVHFFNETDGFVQGDPEGGDFEIYVTSNGGGNWTRISGANIPNPLASEWGIVGYYTAVGNTIWFTTNKGRIYKSTDKGNTWNVYVIHTATADTQMEIAFDDSGINGIAYVDTDFDLTYSTNNGGETWSALTPVGNFYGSGISSVPGTSMFVSVGADYGPPSKMGFSFTLDNGQTWTDLTDYYQNYQMISVDFVSDAKGYIGTFCGEWSDGIFQFGEPFVELVAGFTSTDAASHDTLFCVNTDVTFTSNSEGLINHYDWDFGTDASPAAAMGEGPHTVQYTTAGEKTVSLTVYDSEGSDVFTKTIYVAGSAPATISTITGNASPTAWQTETYSVDNQLYANFEWTIPYTNWTGSSSTNSIDITFDNTVTPGVLGCKAINGCGESNTAELTITVVPTSVEDINNNLTVYPNPSKNTVTVEHSKGKLVEIYDISGKNVYSKITDSDIINISDLTDGVYTIKMSDKNAVLISKIVVLK